MSQKLIWGLLPDDSNHPRIEFGEDTETHEAFLKINGQEIKNYEPETPSEPETPDTPDTPVEPIAIELMQIVTWQELKNLRDEGKLVPGQSYRITDYECSTAQDNTKALHHKFDIIVSAISHYTLSESARVDFHERDDYFKHGQVTKIISSEINMQQQLTIVSEGLITPEWVIYEDENSLAYNEEQNETNKDEFIAFDFLTNNDGITVPVLYKTDTSEYSPEEPDTESPYFYVGEENIDDIIYDKWRKIELNDEDGEHTWASESKKFILTNKIVGEGLLINATVLFEVEEAYVSANLPAWKIKYCLDNDVSRFAWAVNKPSILVKGKWYEYVHHNITSNQYNIWWERKDKTLEDLSEKYILSKCNMDGTGEEAYFTNSSELYPTDWTRVVDVEDRIEHGKGVIYFMQDERGNQCGYDFKNIQFLRNKLVNYQKIDGYSYMASSSLLEGVPLTDLIVPDIESLEMDHIWCYTFSMEDTNGYIVDASVIPNKDLYISTDTEYFLPCVKNKVSSFIDMDKEYSAGVPYSLPNNIFYGTLSNNPNCWGSFQYNTISQSKSNTIYDSTTRCFISENSNDNIIINGENHILKQGSSRNYIAQSCKGIQMNRASENYINSSCSFISMDFNVEKNIVETNSSNMYFKNSVKYVYVTDTDDSIYTKGVSYIVVDMGIQGDGQSDSEIKILQTLDMEFTGQYTTFSYMTVVQPL